MKTIHDIIKFIIKQHDQDEPNFLKKYMKMLALM